RHSYLLLLDCDLQSDSERFIATRSDLNFSILVGRKPICRNSNGVLSGSQTVDAEIAVAGCGDSLLDAGGIHIRHGRADDHAAKLVAHLALQRSGLLTKSRCAQKAKKSNQE